jgi:hypothetical protein
VYAQHIKRNPTAEKKKNAHPRKRETHSGKHPVRRTATNLSNPYHNLRHSSI